MNTRMSMVKKIAILSIPLTLLHLYQAEGFKKVTLVLFPLTKRTSLIFALNAPTVLIKFNRQFRKHQCGRATKIMMRL